MKKILILTLFTLILAVAAMAIGWKLWRGGERAWTTRSPEAEEELEKGLSALMKIYWSDAHQHFARAVELDDQFTVAKAYLSSFSHGEEQERLISEVKSADLAALPRRERFIVDHLLALIAGQGDEVERVVDEYLLSAPDDPLARLQSCNVSWRAEDWDRAAACYRELLERYPNWVLAQYRLGLISQARGRFSDAEEQFRTYIYVAPDQANPYVALGRLLTLLGRYGEAEQALEKAVDIKPDMCEIYWEMMWLHLFAGHLIEAEAALDRLQSFAACDWYESYGLVCAQRTLIRLRAGDREGARSLVSDCLERGGGFYPAAHRLAILDDRIDEALAMEDALRQRITAETKKSYEEQGLRAELAHAEGIRYLATGDLAAASEALRQADELLPYWGNYQASFKLFNRRNLVYGLLREGRTSEAKAMMKRIEAVNPAFARGGLTDLEEAFGPL